MVLLIPFAVLAVVLKLIRIEEFFPQAGASETLAKVSSDVAFGTAWLLLWMLLCWLAKGTARAVVFYLAHALTLVLGIFTVIVAGADGIVRHVELTETTSQEPDYDAALAAVA